MSDTVSPEKIREVYQRITAEVGRVIVGQEAIVRLLLVSLFARGHCLLVGVPGLAKTLLVKTLGDVLNLSFKRIQFTPDLMPSDIIGSELLQEREKGIEFVFQPGPVFAHLLLADEVNRTPPKTQSALLEAMQEHRVTVGGKSWLLPNPFLVVATQNPIELEGTFPLPEAQIDRFLIKLPLGYPSAQEEESILLRFQDGNPLEALGPVASRDELTALPKEARGVRVEESVRRYIVELARATRDHQEVELGASPRGTLALYHAAQAYAAIRGRSFVLPDDVKQLLPYVLTHRIILSPQMRLRGRRPEDVVASVLENVPAPVEK